MKAVFTRLASGAVTLVTGLALSSVTLAASHREPPLIALDPAADITDVYAFRNCSSGWADAEPVSAWANAQAQLSLVSL